MQTLSHPSARLLSAIILAILLVAGTATHAADPAAQAADTPDAAEDKPVDKKTKKEKRLEKKAKNKKNKNKPAKPEIAKVGIPAGSLDGLDVIKGQPVSLEKGKIYVVEYWATWCGPCIKGIPHLTKLQAKYADKGVTVIGITNETDTAKVKAFIEKQGDDMAYTVAIDANRKVTANYMQAYQRNGIPCAFLVDQNSDMVWVGHPNGGMDEVLEMLVAGTFDLDAYTKAQEEKAALRAKAGEITGKYFKALRNGKSMQDARPIAEEIFELNSPQMLLWLAWDIQEQETEGGKLPCDHELAIRLLKKANADTGGQDPSTLSSLAYSLAKTGKLKDAVEAQEKAVALVQEEGKLLTHLKEQLAKYEQALAKQNAG